MHFLSLTRRPGVWDLLLVEGLATRGGFTFDRDVEQTITRGREEGWLGRDRAKVGLPARASNVAEVSLSILRDFSELTQYRSSLHQEWLKMAVLTLPPTPLHRRLLRLYFTSGFRSVVRAAS